MSGFYVKPKTNSLIADLIKKHIGMVATMPVNIVAICLAFFQSVMVEAKQ